MRDTSIYQAATKRLPDNIDLDYYFSIVFGYPENEWITPNNSKDESYTIFNQLASFNLVSIKIVPKWVNSSFVGTIIKFKYNKELKC